MKNALALLAALALLTTPGLAQSPSPIPLPTVAPTPVPVVIQPITLTSAQTAAFLAILTGGTASTPVPVFAAPPAGTAIKYIGWRINPDGTSTVLIRVQ